MDSAKTSKVKTPHEAKMLSKKNKKLKAQNSPTNQ